MKHGIEGFQFLVGETPYEKGPIASLRGSPSPRPDIAYDLVFLLEDRAFPTTFADIIPRGPSIGALEYIDPHVDAVLGRMWPFCIVLRGSVDIPEKELPELLRMQVLDHVRRLLWYPDGRSGARFLPFDQFATTAGYRRQRFCGGLLDLAGNRVPNPERSFVPSEIGDPVGPGVVSFLNKRDMFNTVNELVWSEIMPLPTRTTLKNDTPRLNRRIRKKDLHYNSVRRLDDARRLIQKDEAACAAWFGASAVDAALDYHRERWNTRKKDLEKTLNKRDPFNVKIEKTLNLAGKPSYRSKDPEGWKALGRLYYSRNTSHEADCYYMEDDGSRKEVKSVDQVQPWLDAAEDFILWVESLV